MGTALFESDDCTLMVRINDHTVPYPSSAIRVETDDADLITSWSAPPPEDVKVKRKKGWALPTLPPVLRYRFPFNYVGTSFRHRASLTSDHHAPFSHHAAHSSIAHVRSYPASGSSTDVQGLSPRA
jgi:hypothetical protein